MNSCDKEKCPLEGPYKPESCSKCLYLAHKRAERSGKVIDLMDLKNLRPCEAPE